MYEYNVLRPVSTLVFFFLFFFHHYLYYFFPAIRLFFLFYFYTSEYNGFRIIEVATSSVSNGGNFYLYRHTQNGARIFVNWKIAHLIRKARKCLCVYRAITRLMVMIDEEK